MRIKTFNPSFEYWSLTDEQGQRLTEYLTEKLGNAWTLEPAEVINDTLRNYLWAIFQPAEEIPGEGFLPTTITGQNGFFEDGEALTLEPEPEPTPQPEPIPEPKTLTAYLETHFEISAYLMATIDTPGKLAHETQEGQGRGGLWELAQNLTREFEEKHAGKLWDGDFFEDIDKFINEKETEYQARKK